jgi:hypothetical protein
LASDADSAAAGRRAPAPAPEAGMRAYVKGDEQDDALGLGDVGAKAGKRRGGKNRVGGGGGGGGGGEDRGGGAETGAAAAPAPAAAEASRPKLSRGRRAELLASGGFATVGICARLQPARSARAVWARAVRAVSRGAPPYFACARACARVRARAQTSWCRPNDLHVQMHDCAMHDHRCDSLFHHLHVDANDFGRRPDLNDRTCGPDPI